MKDTLLFFLTQIIIWNIVLIYDIILKNLFLADALVRKGKK